MTWCQWWSIAFLTLTTFGLCLPTQSKDEQDWKGIVILAISAELLGMKCGPLCSSIFPICLFLCSFSCNLDTKFCLHATGGIYVEEKFTNSRGKIQISGSWANDAGGAVLGSSSWGLRHDFEMAVGSGRSTLGSEIEKSWRDYYKCLRHSLIANWFKSWFF